MAVRIEMQRREQELRALREAIEMAESALKPLRNVTKINAKLFQAGKQAGVAVGAYKSAGSQLRKAAQQIAAGRKILRVKQKAREAGLRRFRSHGVE